MIQGNNIKTFFGPPGTGKTTKMLQLVEQEMAAGVKPTSMAFISFTRKATEEAKERAKAKFNYQEKDMPWFRTIHSLCFRAVGLSKDQVMMPRHLREVGDITGFRILGQSMTEDGEMIMGTGKGDRMLFVHNLSRLMRKPEKEVFREFADNDLRWNEYEYFTQSYAVYKEANLLVDYTTMLEMFVADSSAFVPELDVMIVDEAQDLSRLQWEVVQKLAEKTQRIYVAGDDDQAIYRWAGAEVDLFLAVGGDKEVLSHSYRLPRTIHRLAQNLCGRITTRYDKQWGPRDEDGSVNFITHMDHVDFDTGDWLILARNNSHIDGVVHWLRSEGLPYRTKRHDPLRSKNAQAVRAWVELNKGNAIRLGQVKAVYDLLATKKGVTYGMKKTLASANPKGRFTMKDLQDRHGLIAQGHWSKALTMLPNEDRKFFQACIARKEFTNGSRIMASTIHGAKGGEATNVLLMPDIGFQSFKAMQANPDDEHRVFYVGATRARQNLFIAEPQGQFFYDIFS